MKTEKRLKKQDFLSIFIIFFLIPFTILYGVFKLNDRKYYFISLLIISYTIILFFISFEKRQPRAREIIVLAVMTSIAVAGRLAFYMIPQFKPVVAIVIISGVCFGSQSGFIVGAMSGFVSNFFMGQGPWTPWQMFGFGLIGFISGLMFKEGLLQKKKKNLCIFGMLSTFFIYGGLLNPSSVMMFSKKISLELLALSYVKGFWFDLIHSIATGFFLFILAEPMIEKLDRIKVKYGLIEP